MPTTSGDINRQPKQLEDVAQEKDGVVTTSKPGLSIKPYPDKGQINNHFHREVSKVKSPSLAEAIKIHQSQTEFGNGVYNDFGFTAVDAPVEPEANDIVITSGPTVADVDALKEKLQQLGSLFINLLNNLRQNPDQKYILWPNHAQIAETMLTKVQELMS